MSADPLRRGAAEQPLFLFDVGVPSAWPVAEAVLGALDVPAEWVPVALGADPEPDWAEVEARARGAGALPLRRPVAWPPDTSRAMHALAYARLLGKTVAFAQALMRHAYAAGRPLDDETTLFLAGAAAEIHPRALAAAIGQAGTRRAVAETAAAARSAGVAVLPAIVLPGGALLQGPGCLDDAANACAPATPTA